MAHQKTRAVVLRATDYSESSQVLALCTETSGLVHAIAKGSRRNIAKGVAVPDVLDCCEVVFVPKPPPALSILTEWPVIDGFPGLRADLRRIYAALYAVELVLATTDRSEEDAGIFHLLYNLERRLAAGGDVSLDLVRFEIGLLDALGLGPETAHCLECGGSLAGRARFSPAAGGALCEACNVPGSDAVACMAGALASLTRLRRDDDAGRLRVSPAIAAELRSMLNAYWDHVLGRPPRLRRYITARRQPRGEAG